MTADATADRHQVIVIGAGQAGLAAGYHLARKNLRFVIVDERERVGDVWRSRWDSLRLYSPARVDGLPGMRFPAARTAFPSGRQMGDFLEAYARERGLPVRTGVHVDRIRRHEDGSGGFIVEAGEDRLEADQVIVATGAFQRPHVPDFAGRIDPAIRQLHSSAYREPSQLVDGAVLVVGASHSGADIAHEAARHGHRAWLSGRIHGQLPFPVESRRAQAAFPVLAFVAGHFLTLGTPIGRRMAPHVRMGGGPLLRYRRPELEAAGVTLVEARTVGVVGGRPSLADGQVLDVANVVWCTGFRPDFSWIDPPVIGPDGWPAQERGVVSAVPGLYFLGLPFLYSFASMLVAGAGRDARYVVDRIAERAGSHRQRAASPGPALSMSR